MRGFLIKIILALLIALMLHLAAGFLANGRTDAFYLRFTVPRQKSLVLGGSRAAQGIFPEIFNAPADSALFEGPLYDFSFSVAHSPYGPTYLRGIEHVLDTSARNGLFILQVDPWQLSDAGRHGPEQDRSLGVMRTFGTKPNYEYLTRYWDRGWGALGRRFVSEDGSHTVLLQDGRLEAHLPMSQAKITERTRRRLAYYRDRLMPHRSLSDERMAYLGRTIDLLRPHGTVLLVRLPASAAIVELEARLAPTFNADMRAVAGSHQARYLDLSQALPAPAFTDGVHLDGPSGRALSELLAREAFGPQ